MWDSVLPPSPNPIESTLTLTCTDVPKAKSWLLNAPKLEQQTTCFLGHQWHRNAWEHKSKSMRLSRPVNVCNEHMESMTSQFKIRAQRHPRECLGVQNEPRGVPEASRRRPRVSKKRPGDARLDLLVFYSVFKRPRSPGGNSGGARITYRLGRLTELNITKYQSSLHI